VSPKTRRVDYWQDAEAPKPTNRKASASVLVRDDADRVLLLRRPDNDLWTIPTGAVQRGETVAEAGVRECREETGLQVEITGLVGVFSTPDHVIAYMKGDKVKEVRQPINVCLHARPVGGELTRTKEAAEVAWVRAADLDGYDLHPAIRLRITHGLAAGQPYVG
jgi:8-oxo-dGTP pyrophosphatase MutT (NUDIX family)